MSNHFSRFVPENIYVDFESDKLDQIKEMAAGKMLNIIINSKIAFADAGENFKSVKCPFCNQELMSWWGDAMSDAFSNEDGFTNLNIITPCCGRTSSLHNLLYHFQQGFYYIMVEADHDLVAPGVLNNLGTELEIITGMKWREINAHY